MDKKIDYNENKDSITQKKIKNTQQNKKKRPYF